MRHLPCALLITAALLLTACGGDANNTSPQTSPPASGMDMPQDMRSPEDMTPVDMVTGPQTSPPAPDMDMPEDMRSPVDMFTGQVCEQPEQACGGSCVDTTTDIDHCGECDNACGRGSACVDSACLCFKTGRSWCGEAQCVQLDRDLNNCGECGVRCGPAEYCDQGSCTNDGVLGEVVRFTNETRAVARDCGGDWMPAAGPLSVNEKLAVAAQRHAEDMDERQYFEHDNPDGDTPTDRMRAAGYTGRRTGENIAKGQRDARAVVDAWIDSPGHCRNMMAPGYTEIGIGYHNGSSKYWVQNFGSP